MPGIDFCYIRLEGIQCSQARCEVAAPSETQGNDDLHVAMAVKMRNSPRQSIRGRGDYDDEELFGIRTGSRESVNVSWARSAR